MSPARWDGGLRAAEGPVVSSPSPWGPVESVHDVAEGIVWVTTARHGGVWLSRERWAQMPERFRDVVPFAHLRGIVLNPGQRVPPQTWTGPGESGAWYEEDEDACLVVLAFPELHDGQVVWALLDGLGYRWCREELRRAVNGWHGPSRDRAQAVADAWYCDHVGWWVAGNDASDGDGWRVWYQQVGTGDRALRHLTDDEYVQMTYQAVPELPGVPAGHTRAHGRAS